MSLRARIFIIISVLIFLILGISLFLVVRNKNKTAEPQINTPSDNTGATGNGQPNGQVSTGTQTPTGLPAKIATPLEAEKNGVVQLAKVFVERYGTYSSDNDFQNIKEVESFVTPALWSKISAPMNSKTTTQSFVGVTTKVISMDLKTWSDAKATVELKTMRTEEKNGVITQRQENATVDMVKNGSSWLVDKLVWK